MEALQTIKQGGYTGQVHQDPEPMNPRDEFDNIASLVMMHSRYNLGDQPTPHMAHGEDVAAFTPLGLLDHSGLHVYLGVGPHWSDAAGWDSGTIGYAYITVEKMIDAFGEDTPENRDKARQTMLAEVETYDQYLRGDVYGYTIEDSQGLAVDSCWGFFGLEYAKDMLAQAMGELTDDPMGDYNYVGSHWHY